MTASAAAAAAVLPSIQKGFDTSAAYTDQQLKAALDSLLQGSDDPEFDARHLMYGCYTPAASDDSDDDFGSGAAQLSMLQRVTATVMLDYQNYLSSQSQTPAPPSMDELTAAAATFCEQYGPILNLQHVIQQQAPRMALAAEFKRASPSKGDIAADKNAGEQGLVYATAGADIISCLTEPRWFKGTLQDLTEIRLATSSKQQQQQQDLRRRPAILRKDFVINKYQIAEAAAVGADTILLIVAVLPQHLLKELIDYARSLGMEPLVEVHADIELQVALQAGARVIGVNNRNLHTFQMDLSTSERMAKLLKQQGLSFHHTANNNNKAVPADLTLCALSGMSTALDVDRYRQVGLGMCLIGESLMRAPDPAAAIASFCLDPEEFRQQQIAARPDNDDVTTALGAAAYTAGTRLVKVCGITNAEDALVACRAGANLIGVIFAEKSKRKVSREQAAEVVAAVRQFGERDDRLILKIPPTAVTGGTALGHLQAGSYSLSTTTRQRPAVVGVFQNQDPAFIEEMVQQAGLDLVQLHGSEGMAAAHPDQCGGVPAIRVVDIAVDEETGETVSADEAVETILSSLTDDPVAILLDTAIKGAKEGGGGTGKTFDWSLAQKIQDRGLPVIIAGGLTADSVQDCVGQTRPFGIDVSSGVEDSPGKKDHDQVKAFVQGAKKAAAEASKGF